MIGKIVEPRKQRTRQHVIADQSVPHFEGFVLAEGHTVQRLTSDYGYDLVLFTYDAQGYVEPGLVLLQLKASEIWIAAASDHVFDLDIRDYNLWMREKMPVILVLFDASRKRAVWLALQRYFLEDPDRRPAKGAKTVRVRVPVAQVVNRRAIAKIRILKQAATQ
jgi:hypothetical protein